jgi:hypothetical protein
VRRSAALPLLLPWLAARAVAGPPYITDDPEPTPLHHFEIYGFWQGQEGHAGRSTAAGIDFNYGGARDLQLTAVVPFAREQTAGLNAQDGLGNIELAAKYRLLHQDGFGWDVAIFPRYVAPSRSRAVGDASATVLLPVWVQKDAGPWSTFGGAEYVHSRGAGSRDSWLGGWALTRQITPRLQAGAELVHQSAQRVDAGATTALGLGVIFDINRHWHLMGTVGPTLQNPAEGGRYDWYLALLLTTPEDS